jgi:hypothetical protein
LAGFLDPREEFMSLRTDSVWQIYRIRRVAVGCAETASIKSGISAPDDVATELIVAISVRQKAWNQVSTRFTSKPATTITTNNKRERNLPWRDIVRKREHKQASPSRFVSFWLIRLHSPTDGKIKLRRPAG